MNRPGRLGLKALLTLADQTLSSAATFCLNVLMARWMEPSEYGAFVAGFAVFLFLSRFHQALLLEPMSVFAWSELKGRLKEYAQTALRLHWVIGCGLGLLPLLAGGVCGVVGARRAGSIAAMGLAVPLLLLQWTVRRMTYLSGGPRCALRGALVHGVVLVTGISALRSWGRLSTDAVWLLLAVSAVASSVSMWTGAGLNWRGPLGAGAGWREPATLHWRYGKWATGFSMMDSLSEALYLPLIATWVGLPQAAAFRAMENLLQPLQLGLSSFVLLGLPTLAETVKARGRRFLTQAGKTVPAVMGTLFGGYVLVLLVAAPWLTRILYRREVYSEALGILPLLAAALIFRLLGDGSWCVLLRAAARPEAVFWGAVGGASSAVLFGVPSLLAWGIHGAAIGRMASSVVFMFSVLAGFVGVVRDWRPIAALRSL